MDDRKDLLRQQMRERRKTLPDDYIRRAGADIQEQILSSPRYREAESIFLYVSTEKEVPTRRILQQALEDGKRVYVPRCVSRSGMMAVRIRGTEELRPGMMGILEPADCAETAAAGELDLILVPCVAASPDGKRLGHGAGYYDRFLAGQAEHAVCLCFREMLCDEIPVSAHDVMIPLVVTER